MRRLSFASALAILPISCGLAALPFAAGPAAAAPTVGFTENWPAPGTHGWGGGATVANPGAGGVGGVGDGYLQVSLALDGNLGTRSLNAEYNGDWQAAGIQHVLFSLNDVGAPDALEIHFCIGNSGNFWQYNQGFTPPLGSWQEFDVDLSLSANFTQIIGTGTYAEALQHADRILIRHDHAPFVQNPDFTHGDFGIDHLVLAGGVTRIDAMTWGRIKTLYR
jgi:hypothetical protein